MASLYNLQVLSKSPLYSNILSASFCVWILKSSVSDDRVVMAVYTQETARETICCDPRLHVSCHPFGRSYPVAKC